MRWVFALLIGLWTGDAAAQPRYVDVAAAAGIAFEHRNGARGEKQLPETMGSGVAFFDYDDDSCLALLLIGCQEPEPPSATGRAYFQLRAPRVVISHG